MQPDFSGIPALRAAMDSDRWPKVEALFHHAMEREPGARAAFLAETCVGDESLRREVESLLAQRGSTEGLIDPSAWEAQAETATMLAIGVRLGPYEILGRLGAGGMGQVYRAVDTRLGRQVAIKTSARRFSGRFEREARAISALNHPHICTLYDIGPNYLVMELVEGETLSARIAKGALPPDQVRQYGVQIAEALAAAHVLGIVHRDLKPGNVMVTRTGIKVLDFGLAKFTDSAETPKPAETLTAERAIIGTPAYMAPEQLSGEEVDARTDLFSFGAVLYEMATGRRAFPRDLDRTPPPSAKTDAKLQRIIAGLLKMDRADRYQTAAEVSADLEEPRLRRHRPAAWIVSLAAGAAALLFAGVWWGRSNKPPDRSQWVQITSFPDSVTQPAFSQDGRMLAFLRGPNTFLGQSEVYVKLLPDGEPAQLTHDGLAKMSPIFSPDSSRIAYTALDPGTAWDTWTIPVTGGTPQLWLPNAAAVTWLDQHRLLYSEIKSGFHMAIATSLDSRTEHRDVYTPVLDSGMAHRSYRSADGRWVLIVEMDDKGVWQPCRLAPFDGSSAGQRIGPSGAPCTAAGWSPDGKWMYLTASAGDFHVWRQRFPDGRPEQLTSGPTAEEGITVSPDGRSLITAVGSTQRGVWLHDERGNRQTSLEGYTLRPELMPGARKVVYLKLQRYQNGTTPGEIWEADLDSGRNEAVLPGLRVNDYSISPDGRILACVLRADGRRSLWLARVDRSSPPYQIGSIEPKQAVFGSSGTAIFLASDGPKQYLYEIQLDGTGVRKLRSESIIELHNASPDGRWVSAPGSLAERAGVTFETAFSTRSNARVSICSLPCRVGWAPDGKYLYASWSGGFQNLGAVGRTYVLSTRPETVLPDIPPSGFRSESEMARIPGVRVIDAADVGPGASPDIYVYSRENVQRNLYRIPLP